MSVDQGIKSRPKYAPLRLDLTGRRHLMVTDLASPPLDAMEGGIIPPSPLLEVWTVARASTAVSVPFGAAPPGPEPLSFRSAAHLLGALEHRLSKESMGFRLYGGGSEAFLWDVFKISNSHGLGRHEVFLNATGSQARRIYCVHCRSLTEHVTTNVATCSGCAAPLFVRDHFSRRMAAYMGVQIDAEVPGDIPETEEIYG
jgi:hypothetical protein